mgnify:CR=1 FL=1
MTVQLGEEQIVDHGDFAKAPTGNITNGNYVFLGWFYEDVVNGKKVEKAFVFEGIPVLEDMNIYARWGSHFSVDYKIYYKQIINKLYLVHKLSLEGLVTIYYLCVVTR